VVHEISRFECDLVHTPPRQGMLFDEGCADPFQLRRNKGKES